MSQYYDLSETGRIYMRSVEKLAAIQLQPKEDHAFRVSQEDLEIRYPTLCHLINVMREMETLAAYSTTSGELDHIERILREVVHAGKETPSHCEDSSLTPRNRKENSNILNDPTIRSALVDLEHIAAFMGQMRYAYPDLCYVCKHRDEPSREFCLHCISYQGISGMEDTRASNFERKNKKMEE